MEEDYENNGLEVQPAVCSEEENDYGASQYVNNLLTSEWGEEVKLCGVCGKSSLLCVDL